MSLQDDFTMFGALFDDIRIRDRADSGTIIACRAERARRGSAL